MTRSKQEEAIANILAARTGTNACDWYLVFKARHGMQIAFEEIRAEFGPGDVATQLLTCCTAVDPILVAGLNPRYSEIDFDTAMVSAEHLDCTADLRAVVAQHTYGMVDNAATERLAARAHAAGALLIEDCAHCVGRMATNESGAPVADISFHSFGIEKMLHTLLGGAVWVNPATPFASVAQRVRKRLATLPVSGARLDMCERLFVNECRVFNHVPRPVARGLRHGLAAVGLLEPAVSTEEQRGGVSHAPMRPSAHVCEQALTAFERLEGDEQLRAEATRAYCELFADMPGVEVPAATALAQPLLKFPIMVKDTAVADRIIDECCSAGYFTTCWYRPELGPGVLDEAAYRLPSDRSSLTVCDRMVAQLATLPTDQGAKQAYEIAELVRRVVSS